MIAWSIIGLIYFNHIIRKDHTRKFGKAILVWVSLLSFVVILSLTWSQRMNEARENAVIKDISFIRNAFGETRVQMSSKILHRKVMRSLHRSVSSFLHSLVRSFLHPCQVAARQLSGKQIRVL